MKSDGQSIVIARLHADASSFRFKTEVMALVRSVEQQYWSLAQTHAAFWAADRSVNVAQDVITTELNELTLSRGGIGCYFAEASDHLKRLEHDLVERTSAVLVAECGRSAISSVYRKQTIGGSSRSRRRPRRASSPIGKRVLTP